MQQQTFGRLKTPRVPNFTEKRSERRQRVLKAGTIMFNSGYGSFSAKIRNMTEAGALIEVYDSQGIPPKFDFLVHGDQPVTKPSRIVWRTNYFMGIKFI